MGTGSSKNAEGGSHAGEDREDHSSGQQLYVSLKMENYKRKSDLIPHVYGSLSMERESKSTWELSFVVPPNHETLDFKFLLKPKYGNAPCIVEEGPNRLLAGGHLQGDARLAIFRFNADEVLEHPVVIKANRVSPFDLAASWRAYQDNLQPSTVRGIPDNGSSASLELDLEHYVVPAPSTSANSALVYAANMTETPRSLTRTGMEIIVPDPSKGYPASGMVESKSVGTFSSLQKQDCHRGLFVDRGVGSPRLVKSSSSSAFTLDLKSYAENKNPMPAAAGAVAAAAVADQMLGPKEDRHLAIVLVGLPARGKTFTAAKLTRYLRWLGHDTKHFNVGKYRRLKHGTNQSADFFRADNPEGVEARNEVAALAMEDMISWMQEGGQIIFLETLCNDERIIERNIRLKIQQSPDYAEEPDFEAGLHDFKIRLANYEKVYEPVEEGSYIKMIDMVNNISGYLPGRIVFFLVNTHLTPRPILLTRHGESMDNVRGRIGGDTVLSDAGELYARKLANFVEKRLKSERAASYTAENNLNSQPNSRIPKGK
ncbi:hypothetical protein CRG98_006352 [Punica granatum]|uniref:CBM20 domain-containing protein n=1 Tax=Punica granatum TaxID=22663 RepID=A0A2I0KXR0_PUNGR|nr:hypothetical protein CRG98_006352 [Punica granatum]